VNMTASELSSWLETEASTSSGWSKNDGSGESVGHASGRHIVRILEKNPDKDSGMLLHFTGYVALLVQGWQRCRGERKEE
jgi:hypothetical protein